MPTECEWTRGIVKEMRACGAMVFACVAQKMQEPGWPDRFVCHPWWTGWIEFKGLKTPVSTKQRIVIRELNCRKPGLAVIARYPGIIEGTDYSFTTGKELLECLRYLSSAGLIPQRP